ncbi:MAG TPA: hypothetical protein VIH57_09400, partial [Bacteroidales bacterium]
MNRIIATFLIISLATSAFGQKKKSAVRNKLKSMVVYEERVDKTPGKAVKDEEVKFDTQGNISEEIE